MVAFIIAALLTGSANSKGNNNQGAVWNQVYWSFMSWNDLQSTNTNTVFNTTGCSWNDMDDIYSYIYLPKTLSTSYTMCNIKDYGNDGFYPHQILYKISSSTANLNVSLSDDRGDFWTPTTPAKIHNNYVYSFCIADVMNGVDGPYPIIPDTNGGIGYITHYVLSISTPKQAVVNATFEIAPAHSLGEYGWVRLLKDVPCPN